MAASLFWTRQGHIQLMYVELASVRLAPTLFFLIYKSFFPCFLLFLILSSHQPLFGEIFQKSISIDFVNLLYETDQTIFVNTDITQNKEYLNHMPCPGEL